MTFQTSSLLLQQVVIDDISLSYRESILIHVIFRRKMKELKCILSSLSFFVLLGYLRQHFFFLFVVMFKNVYYLLLFLAGLKIGRIIRSKIKACYHCELGRMWPNYINTVYTATHVSQLHEECLHIFIENVM